MDIRIAQKIRMLGKEIPKEWKKKGIITEKPLERQKDIASRLVNRRNLPKEFRKKLHDKLEEGYFDKTIDKIDQRVADKIDNAMTNIVQRELASGRLPPPSRCCVVSRGRCSHA